MSPLIVVLLAGLAAFPTTLLIRALPPGRGWAATGKKPWACNLCMSSWTTLAWSTGLGGWRGAVYSLAAAAVTWWLLELAEMRQPKSRPPIDLL